MPTKGDLARERIIQAALKVFNQRGFVEATLQEVSRRSGVRQSGIYYYFKNKDELFKAVLEASLHKGRQFIADHLKGLTSPREMIVQYFDATLEWTKVDAAGSQMLILLYYQGAVRAEASVLYASVLQIARARILEILAAGLEAGEFRAPLGLARTAELLHDALLGGVVNYLSTRASSQIATRTAEDKWREYLELVLGSKGAVHG